MVTDSRSKSQRNRTFEGWTDLVERLLSPVPMKKCVVAVVSQTDASTVDQSTAGPLSSIAETYEAPQKLTKPPRPQVFSRKPVSDLNIVRHVFPVQNKIYLQPIVDEVNRGKQSQVLSQIKANQLLASKKDGLVLKPAAHGPVINQAESGP